MIVRFTDHALESIAEFVAAGFCVTRDRVEQVVAEPERLDEISRHPQVIAQQPFDDKHVLRVVFRYEFNYALVITVYIGRRKQYER